MAYMARRPREEVAGAVWHVFARGNGKQDIYIDDDDRRFYLRLLGKVVITHAWVCLAYCLMDNHVHLLLETPQPNLAAGMQRLHGVYAQTMNARHGWSGHVFQGRYGAVAMRSDEQLLHVARYIARNPVDAGLCGEAGDWPWSSHAATLGGAKPPAWLDVQRLLGFFGMWGGEPRARYAEFVALR
jgi:REP element-mobilizing transposase RayT